MNEGTTFQQKVWCEIDKIPRGAVITYSQISKNIGIHKKAIEIKILKDIPRNSSGKISYRELNIND